MASIINIKHHGSFKRTEAFLTKPFKQDPRIILQKYGEKGVAALSSATPVLTGMVANSWGYEIQGNPQSGYKLFFTNSAIEGGAQIALLIQYGHGTRNGGYVEGRDYINPALAPVFDQMAQDLWKEVNNA